MKKYLLVFSILIVIGACQSAEQKEAKKLEANFKTFFQENYLDSTAILDSFKFIKLDTITERMLLLEQSAVLTQQFESLSEIYKLNTRAMSNGIDQMKLYRMIESPELVAMERKEVEEKSKKGDIIKAELDTVLTVIEQLEKKYLKADSLTPIGFQGKCAYQVRLKDKSVKQDTTFILVNLNKDIIDRKDFLNLPYKVDYDKID